MAKAADLNKIDLTLRNVGLFVEGVPDAAEQWAGWDEEIQADFTFEWMGVMDHLTYLPEEIAAGRATPAQVEAYQRLQIRLRELGPTLQALELHVPAELLHPVTPTAEARSAG